MNQVTKGQMMKVSMKKIIHKLPDQFEFYIKITQKGKTIESAWAGVQDQFEKNIKLTGDIMGQNKRKP